MRIIDVKRWDSCGDEFIRNLEDKGIDYNILFRVEVFDAVSIGYSGGKEYDIIEYESNGRKIVACGGFGCGDYVVEEVYLIDLDEGEQLDEESVAELLRDYINNGEY